MPSLLGSCTQRRDPVLCGPITDTMQGCSGYQVVNTRSPYPDQHEYQAGLLYTTNSRQDDIEPSSLGMGWEWQQRSYKFFEYANYVCLKIKEYPIRVVRFIQCLQRAQAIQGLGLQC